MSDNYLLLDTCVAINLSATDRLAVIASALDVTFLMVDQAAAEMGYLRDEIDGQLVQTRIPLEEYFELGVVRAVTLGDLEIATYVDLAAVVDDGEAASIAVALHRGLQMATDDRKARRVCAARGLREPLRTLGILRAYVEAAKLSDEETRANLRRVRTRASFRPSRSDPNDKWWCSYVGED